MKHKNNKENTFTLIFSPSIMLCLGFAMDVLARYELKFTFIATLSLFLVVAYRYVEVFFTR